MNEQMKAPVIWFLASFCFGAAGLFYLEAAAGIDPALAMAIALEYAAFGNVALNYLISGLLAFFCAVLSLMIGVLRWRVAKRSEV